MAQLATVPGAIGTPINQTFTQTNGTQAKILQDVTPATGSLGGGCRVYDLVISSSDTNTNAVKIWQGSQVTLYANMGTVTITSQNAINRTTGSFVTDGYQVGDVVMIFGDTVTAGNNGVPAVVTSVASGALTVSGTPFTNETAAAGFRVAKVTPRSVISIQANAGTSSTVANVQVIANAIDQTKDALGVSLGATGMLIASMNAQVVGSVPSYVSITGNVMLY